MKTLKRLFALTAIAAAVAASGVNAAPGDTYQATFQGLTFTFLQTDPDSLKFEISGTPSSDWAGVKYLAAFDLKDLGLEFDADGATAVANGPGASNLAGLNSQMSASNLDCLTVSNGAKKSICFDIKPDYLLPNVPFDLVYMIDFSDPLGIANTGGTIGPHLQIAFTNTQDGSKVGSLYSQNVGLSSSSNTSSGSSNTSSGGSSNTSSGSNGQVPEPNSSILALLGVVLLGGTLWSRRRSLHS